MAELGSRRERILMNHRASTIRRRQEFTGETYQQALRAIREFGTERIVAPELTPGQTAFIREFFVAVEGRFSFTGASFSDGRLTLRGEWDNVDDDPAQLLLSDVDQTSCYGFRARPVRGSGAMVGVDLHSAESSYDGQEIRILGDDALSKVLVSASRSKGDHEPRTRDVATLAERLNRKLVGDSRPLLPVVLRRAALLPHSVDISNDSTVVIRVAVGDADSHDTLVRVRDKLLDPQFGMGGSCYDILSKGMLIEGVDAGGYVTVLLAN